MKKGIIVRYKGSFWVVHDLSELTGLAVISQVENTLIVDLHLINPVKGKNVKTPSK